MESFFWLIMDFVISSFACFAIIICNDRFVRKISERKWVRIITHSIFGGLTFLTTFAVLLICFFGK